MTNIKCPRCGTCAEYIPRESEICPECGGELKPAENPSGCGDAFSSPDIAALLARVADANRRVNADADNAEPVAERSKKKAVMPDAETHMPSARSNPYLEIDYNTNLFFVNGSASVIRLRLIPRSNRLRGIMLFMETHEGDGKKLRCEIPITEMLQCGMPIEARHFYRPEKISGRLSFDFYVGCVLETETKYSQFSIEHKVYDLDQPTGAAAQQIIINQDIKASEAGDVSVRDNIGDALRDMRAKAPSVHELIDRLNDLPPQFVRQELRDTTWRPETMIVRGNPYPADRLLLEWNGIRLLLFGKKHLKLGRAPGLCDLVVRTTGGGHLGPKDYPNNTVSRLHAELLYGGDCVQLFDKSSYGTYIGGRRPDSAGLPIPESATIEFGDIHWQMEQQFCRMRQGHTICRTCIASRVKAMTFTRKDREPEYYLLVWQCCELGRVIPELSDWTVFFRDNSFFIRTPEQNFYYLRPGSAFSVHQQFIKVNYFQQN